MDIKVDIMNVPECEILNYQGYDVAILRFKERMEVLSSAVHNGGTTLTDHLLIMEVPKNYFHDDPRQHVAQVCEGLGLPLDSVGFMTAAEVRYVFNTKVNEFAGVEAFAAVTAGLSNQVIAGEILTDWERRSKLSNERHRFLHAGTINIIGVSSLPMTQAAKVNILIAMTEAKTAALGSLGYRDTGTTSDAIAIVSPVGDPREEYAGTGMPLGIVMARSVKDCVRTALINRGDDSHGSYIDILAEAGITRNDLMESISETLDLDMEEIEWLSDKLDGLRSNVVLASIMQYAVSSDEIVKTFSTDKGQIHTSAMDDLSMNVATYVAEVVAEQVSGQVGINVKFQIYAYNIRTIVRAGTILEGAVKGLVTGISVSRESILSYREASK